MRLMKRWFVLAALMLLAMTGAPKVARAGNKDITHVDLAPPASPIGPSAVYSSPPPYFGDNPSFGDIKNKLIAAGQKYSIPPHILFGIAFQESGWNQFRSDRRTVYHLEPDGRVGVGIMQMTVSPSASDYGQLCTDIDYNIDRGAALLVGKWNATPVIGDNDRAKLENWYYAIWAYNGFICNNNYPNLVLDWIANSPSTLGSGQWQNVTITKPAAYTSQTGCSAGTLPQPTPYHVDANYDGVIDGDFFVGQGSSRQQAFIDAYNRNGTSGNMGNPINATHWSGNTNPVVVQDFQGGAYGDCALFDDEPAGVGAWALRGAMRGMYYGMGSSDSVLGPPRSDEGVATPSTFGTTGAVQTFRQGHIHFSGIGGFYTLNDIDAKYAAIGGSGSFLGFPKTNEFGVDSAVSGMHGYANVFEGGHIFHPDQLGTYFTRGDINARYAAMGSMGSVLGFPKSDEVTVSTDHYVQDFEGGSFYSFIGGTYYVVGGVKTAYDAVGSWSGFWGFPISDNLPLTAKTRAGGDGFLQYFENGYCYNSPLGSFLVRDPIRPKYGQQSWEAGPLGYPTSSDFDVTSAPTGKTGKGQSFEGGEIYSNEYGTFTVPLGSIHDRYRDQNNESGPFGFPISDPYSFYNRTRQDFEGGSITDGVVITLALNPTAVTGGQASTGTITLSGPGAPGGTVITLSSSATGVATVPATVTVPEGATTATFTITTAQRSASATATIHAALADLSSDSTLTVNASLPTVSFTTSATTPAGTTPINGGTIYNTMPLITGVAADAIGGVTKVDLYLYQHTTTSGVNKWWTGSEWQTITSGDKPKLACALSPAGGGAKVSWSRGSSLPTGANLPDGVYYMIAYAYDTAGKRATAVSNFKKATDTTAPTVGFTTSTTAPKGTTPVSGGTVYNTIPAITGVAADVGSAVSRVDLYLYQRTTTSGVNKWWTGSAWQTLTTEPKPKLACTLSPVGGKNVTWTRSSGLPTGANLPDGVYYMSANAYDAAGKPATAVSNFRKATDTTAPTIGFTTSATTPVGTTPISGDTVYNTMPAITGVAADAESGVAKVDLYLYQRTTTSGVNRWWTGTEWLIVTSGDKPKLACTLSLVGGKSVTWSRGSSLPTGANLPDGAYYMAVNAYDAAGKSVSAVSNFIKATKAAAASASVATIALPSNEADVSSQSVRLTSLGALDAETSPKCFTVLVNGTAVPVTGVEVAEDAATLLLPDGALHAGDAVAVTWSGLRDTTGAALADGNWLGSAK